MTASDFFRIRPRGIYSGADLEGAIAIDHYEKLCLKIREIGGQYCCSLLEPMRLLIMRLEDVGEFGRAVSVAYEYKEVSDRSVYIDEQAGLAVDLLISRLLENSGEILKAKELRTKTLNRFMAIYGS